MFFKIDWENNSPIPDGIPLDYYLAQAKYKLAYELGKFILENSDFITDDEIISGKIQKACLFFPDPERVKRVLDMPGRDRLLDENFK